MGTNSALNMGFDKVGIAGAKALPKSSYLDEWLNKGYHGEMKWMENYLDKRRDVCELVPGAKSVIVVAHNYYTPYQHSNNKSRGKISRYAWGEDYHKIIKKRLKKLLLEIKQYDPEIEGRLFVDTAPIQEKLWAQKAGIGWQGKNTNVISMNLGSWFFLGELVINRELIYDEPGKNHCGKCNACINACPTQALEPYRLDARKCISCLTIELRNKPIPSEFSSNLNNWIFGCDICQDVCPWNRTAVETNERNYFPAEGNVRPVLEQLLNMTESKYKNRFRKSPVSRAGYQAFIRNVKLALFSSKNK